MTASLTPALLAPLALPLRVIAAATNFLASSACCRNLGKSNKVWMISSFNQTGDQFSRDNSGPPVSFGVINRTFESIISSPKVKPNYRQLPL
jgi:hypothetical protein